MTSPRDFRELNDHELNDRLTDAQDELFKLRFQLAAGKQDNSARLGQVRKDIARISTILREREIEAAEGLSEVNR